MPEKTWFKFYSMPAPVPAVDAWKENHSDSRLRQFCLLIPDHAKTRKRNLDEKYEGRVHPLPGDGGFRNFKIHFPNVLNIVEGSVEISESLNGEWEICKIFSADPIQEEFLHCLAQSFVEYIDTQQSQQ
jgi:hypothetical protein